VCVHGHVFHWEFSAKKIKELGLLDLWLSITVKDEEDYKFFKHKVLTIFISAEKFVILQRLEQSLTNLKLG